MMNIKGTMKGVNSIAPNPYREMDQSILPIHVLPALESCIILYIACVFVYMQKKKLQANCWDISSLVKKNTISNVSVSLNL